MLPLSRVPVFGLSRRKLTVCPLMKFEIDPVSVAGREETVVVDSDIDAALTVAVKLCVLSDPCQFCRTGVTLYFQLPAGTAASVQLVAATVPEQAEPIVCSWPLVL